MIDDLTRRGFGLAAAALGAGLAGRAAAAADAGLAARLQFVDPELRGPLEADGGPRIPMLREQDIPAFRSQGGQAFPSPLPSPPVREVVVPSRRGAPPVKIYLVDGGGGGAADRGAILHVHGGGYILGSPQSDLPNLQRIAAALGCLIASVDYRLAPETRFPGSLEDNYAALLWLRDQSHGLRVDPRRIVVMGESAGGGHAAALALAARDRGEIRLAGQVLVFPMLDDRTGSGQRPPPQEGAFIWTPELNRLGWTALLGVPAGSAAVPRGAVPARAESLAGLPPTFIGVGALDLFVREDIEYARRLVDAGVPTDLMVVPGAYHAFEFLVPTASVSRRFSQAIDDALSRMLRPTAG
ncbi:MAG: alpha/beta hydrolase [Caulobacteraceae bacterium]